MTLSSPRFVALAAAVLSGIVFGCPGPTGPTPAFAQSLPGSSSAVAPIRRGSDGRLEVVDPTKSVGPAGRGPCGAGTICVGPGRAYATLTAAAAAARPGDVIEIVAGSYPESVVLKMPKLVVRGVGGRPHFDCVGLRPAQDKACLLLAAPDITLENLEISGAEIGGGLGGNAACVRNEPNLDFTLRKVVCHGSQNGLLTNGGSMLIELSEFYDNGWSGSTHNIYLSGDCVKATVRNSIFRDARVGHEFKSRCRVTDIADSTFKATRASRALDLSDGGLVTIKGGEIIQGPGVQNHEMIGYAPESCKNKGGMTLEGVKIVGNNANGVIANFDKCEGAAIRLVHVEFQGTRPKFRGLVTVE